MKDGGFDRAMRIGERASACCITLKRCIVATFPLLFWRQLALRGQPAIWQGTGGCMSALHL